MRLYHGSDREIKKPDTLHSRLDVDFGKGFYATSIYEQAVKWAQRFHLRQGKGVVSVYNFDEDCLKKCSALVFEEHTEEWLDFISKCRKKLDDTKYDVVMGGVANDRVFNTIELYHAELITREDAIQRLKFVQPSMQICFRTQSIMDIYLHYERSENI